MPPVAALGATLGGEETQCPRVATMLFWLPRVGPADYALKIFAVAAAAGPEDADGDVALGLVCVIVGEGRLDPDEDPEPFLSDGVR